MNKYTIRQTPLAATIGSVLATGSLHAATITVDTANDTVVPGECSLRAAIESANTGLAAGGCDSGSAGADEIVFDQALAGSVITLGGGLIIENSLTITGPGSGELAIDGGELYRHFDVDFSSNAYQELAISGMTLRNGYTAGDGGAIRMQSQGIGYRADLTLEDLFIDGSYSADSGGAVAFHTDYCGALTIRDSVLVDNEAGARGGGVAFSSYFGCGLTIDNSLLGGNSAASGGAVSVVNEYAESPQVSIGENSFIALNQSKYGGGLLVNASGGAGIQVQDSTFFNNTADIGGAMMVSAKYAYQGDGFDLAIARSNIVANQAYYAGGILAAANNDGGSADAVITAADSNIIHNQAYAAVGGAGIFMANGETSITGSTISGNRAGYFAGGLALQAEASTVVMADSVVGFNQAEGYGGGVYAYIEDSGLTIDRTVITGNRAGSYAGGIAALAYGGSLVELRNSEVSLNTAYVGGGAIFYATSAQIENTTFSNNHAFQRAAFSAATDTASIRLTTVADNTAVAIGGAYVSASTGCTIDNSLIAGNTAYGYSDLLTDCDTAYSLIGDSAGSYYTDAGGNIVDVDPLIGPLADNGGPTQTRALDPGSPAINAGDPAFAPPPDFDQRGPGFGRLVAGRVDMGAYEFQAEPEDGVFSDRFEVE